MMSRCSGRVGATPNPQLPMMTLVTPCQFDGVRSRVPEDLGVVVRVDVDEAGREHETVEVDDLASAPRHQLARVRRRPRCDRR